MYTQISRLVAKLAAIRWSPVVYKCLLNLIVKDISMMLIKKNSDRSCPLAKGE